MHKVKILPSSDIKTSAYEVGAMWFACIQMPWHQEARIVVNNLGNPIPYMDRDKAIMGAQSAVIGQWQNHCMGTRNGVLNPRTQDKIDKVFGKKRRRRRNRSKRVIR